MPTPLDIQDGEEALSDISPDIAPPNGETDEQRTAREKKNKARQIRRNRAQHRRKEWSGISRLVETLNDGAWLHRQHMNNVYGMKKQNDSTKTVMPSEPLHHATLSLSSWK